MSAKGVLDEPLRVRALDVLGPFGDALAREALESGAVRVEHEVLAWEGSHGTSHAHRIVLVVGERLAEQLLSKHAARDGLAAALAAAMAERPGHNSVADVCVEAGELERSSLGPYRDPRPER